MVKIPFLNRLKIAYKVLTSPYGVPRKTVVVKKQSLQAAINSLNQPPLWHLIDYLTYAKEGYGDNALVRGAIDYKMRALISAPMRAYKGSMSNPELVENDGVFEQLLMQPNQWQSGYEFQQANTAFLNIHGNAFIYLDRFNIGEMPKAMYSLRPDRVFIVPKKEVIPGEMGLAGYFYIPRNRSSAEPFPILPENMIHIKFPNPLDDYEGIGYGLSPLMSGAHSIDVDNQVTYFLKMFFENNTMLGGVLKFDDDLSPEEADEARERFAEIYGGVENWGGVAVLDKGASYERVAMSFRDMQFKEIDARNESRILMPLGVPGMLIGAMSALQRSTFSNFEQADKVFWQNTFSPELSLHEIEYKSKLTIDGVYPRFDRSKVPALQANVLEQLDGAYKAWSMGTPRRAAFMMVGLTVERTPNDDVSYIPNSVVDATAPKPVAGLPAPMKTPVDVEEEEDATETEEESDGKKKLLLLNGGDPKKKSDDDSRWSELEQAAISIKVDEIAVSWEEAFGDAAVEAFKFDLEGIQALITGYKKAKFEAKASITWTDLEPQITDFLNDSSIPNWRELFRPQITGVMAAQGEEWGVRLGFEFDLRNIEGEAWFEEYVSTFAQPISETTGEALHDLLAQAQAEGWSHEQLANHMDTVFQQWMQGDLSEEDFEWLEQRMPFHRREAIARTETMHASNAGSYNMFRDWGLRRKRWLAAIDDRTRDAHQDASGQVRDIDDHFSVGGSRMMYPLDTSMGAALNQIVNCRCTIVPEED